ncbi:MAG: hypothetical protein H0X16_09230 [Chloroflexi bacterium]|nr:hypothetical protein [Chloroflexota bacterium]
MGGLSTWADSAWTSFLDALEKLLVPDWNDYVALLPIAVLLGLIGPIISLLALVWLHHWFTRRRGRVRYADLQPVAAERDELGAFVFPPNTPYCPRDGLLYPPTATRCNMEGDELLVRCPVDSATRVAGEQLCRVCGTRYVLGASTTGVAVQRRHGPPEGGAAVA